LSNLLYLVHRLPYPPNKGDKVRSYHLLKHLAARHRVFLGSFIDDPDDEQHVDALRALCADVHVERLNPSVAKLRSLSGLLRGEALTLSYYRHPGLARWVQKIQREQRLSAAVVFSSPMAQYVDARAEAPLLVDLVDVDSAKWTQYAPAHRWPLSWLYRREGRMLLEFERAVVARAAHSFLVTDAEVDLFRRLAPECADKVEAVGNGVNADYFSPEHAFPSPFAEGEVPVVFTGAMDYWPNVDAVVWFATEVLPRLRTTQPDVRFYIVGMRPAPAVQALSAERVIVTGTVPDVRPYLAHARVVVAPLRVARGIQNKVLEAMAMARPVVASTECASGIDATPGVDFDIAADIDAYVARIDALLRDPARAACMGAAGRSRVLAHYDWDARLSRFDRWLLQSGSLAAPAEAHAACLPIPQ
jgi:sugar transferase (PEP-CTERM/EpsH1 system associated)